MPALSDLSLAARICIGREQFFKRSGKFLRCPAAQRRLLLRALWLLAIVRLGLWLLPFRTMSRWAQSASQRSPHTRGSTDPDIEQVCRAISFAARFVPRASCLTQALVGQILLAQAGHAVDLRIGVARKNGASLQAHAWLESAGRVILGNLPDLSHMQPLRGAR